MKLIDLLVRELPKRGGWPEGAVEAGFLCSNTTLYFVDANGGCPSEWIIDMGESVEDNDVEISMNQYESALAASQKVEWVDGLPPVGCECESKQFAQVNWAKFKVVAVCDGHVFGFWGNGVSTALDSKMWEFRPLRSEADKKRYAAAEAIDWYMPEFITDTPNDYYHAKKIYDAIAAGKIPGVKLED